MTKYRLSIRKGPISNQGFSVERIGTLSGRVACLGSFSHRADAIRFAAQVSAKTGWPIPSAQILPFDRRASA